MLADADAALVTRERAIPGLATVLSSAALHAFVHADADASHDAVISYVRYKAGHSCLTSLDVFAPSGTSTHVVRAYADDAAGAEALARDAERAAQHGGTVRIELDRQLLATTFPHDRAIPALARLHDAVARGRLFEAVGLPLGRVEPTVPHRLVYKPARRYVARVDAEGVPFAVVKGYTRANFAALGPIPEWLDGSDGVRAARELGRHERRSVRSIEWLPGELLADRIANGTATADELRRVGAALAALHAGPIAGWPTRSAVREATSLRALAIDVGALLPDERGRLSSLADIIARQLASTSQPLAPTHGDCYAKQFLVDHTVLGVIDFDEAAIGDAHADLALFLAHLHRDAARGTLSESRVEAIETALLAGYTTAGGSVDRRWLALRLADALLRLTPHPFRHRHPDWPVLTRTLIDRAERALANASSRRPSAGAAGPANALALDPSLQASVALLSPGSALTALRARRLGDARAIRAVHEVSVMRHKPGRRAVLSFHLTLADGVAARWIGKVRSRGTDERPVILAQALRRAGLVGEGGASVGVPRPLGVVDAHHLSLFERVDGTPATALLLTDGDPHAIAQQMAMAMTTLHCASVSARRRRTVADELETLRVRVAAWQDADQSLAPSLSLMSRRCAALAEPLRHRAPRTLLHRDLYPDQLLLEGTRTWIVDLDLAADGDPALDAGNMVAHLLELARRTPTRRHALVHAAHTFATAALHTPRSLLSADAIARYTVLSLARLAEIARHHEERRRFASSLLHSVIRVTDDGIDRGMLDLDAICHHFSEDRTT